jgi:catechol 2,3-dioxygenase-like lactoylglutathione lyase family enzyme
MTVKRMDNVGIVVEDIDAAIEFFVELGLTLEGRMPVDGEWAGRVTGVRDQRVEIATMRTRHRVRSPNGARELAGIPARHVRSRGY